MMWMKRGIPYLWAEKPSVTPDVGMDPRIGIDHPVERSGGKSSPINKEAGKVIRFIHILENR